MDPWQYDGDRDLDQSLFERLRHFPRKPDMLIYGMRLASAMLCRGWLRTYHRLSITGRENLPAHGSFVMVANHGSHLDTLCLLAALPLKKLHYAFPAAAQDYFFVNTPRALLASVVVNALPFDRRASSRNGLKLCRQMLENDGNVLILFPEGTRSCTGTVGQFKPGIGLLTAGTDYPVVPCYLKGAHAAWPKGGWFPRPRKIRVRIGAPRTYSHFECNKISAQRICSELREAVLALAPDPVCRVQRSWRQEIA